MFERRHGYVSRDESSLSDREVVGRAIFHAFRCNCLAYLLFSERIFIGRASSPFANGNGNRFHFYGHVRDNDRGESFRLSIT